MMRRMNPNRLVPPGVSWKRELALCLLMALILIFGFSLPYFPALREGLDGLYTVRFGKRILIEGARMPGLHTLLRGKFIGFLPYALFCLSFALSHYLSFFAGSRSIYLMRRLPDAGELRRRTLGFPLRMLLLGAVLTLLLAALYALIYRLAVPAACLPDPIFS